MNRPLPVLLATALLAPLLAQAHEGHGALHELHPHAEEGLWLLGIGAVALVLRAVLRSRR